MDETQNITLALPKRLLRRLKHLAVEQDVSVSALMRRLIEDYVASEGAYEEAMRAHLKVLEGGFPMGTQGRATWTRDELHERR